MGQENLCHLLCKRPKQAFVSPDQMALPNGCGGLLIGDSFWHIVLAEGLNPQGNRPGRDQEDAMPLPAQGGELSHDMLHDVFAQSPLGSP
jgi:hypothetical protein